MATSNVSIQQAVQNAMAAQTTESATAASATSSESAQTETSTSSSGTGETDSAGDSNTRETTSGTASETTESSTIEVSESPEEINSALNLFRTLKDPTRQKEAIRVLAEQAGIVAKETGATTADAKNAVAEILREALGDENSELADKLSGAIEKILDEKVTKPSEAAKLRAEAQRVQADVDAAITKIQGEFPDYKKHEIRMTELMQEVSPGPRSTPYSYLKRLYEMASGTAKVAETTSQSAIKRVTKITQNAKAVNTTASSDVDETRVKSGSQRPTARQAVMDAAKALGLG